MRYELSVGLINSQQKLRELFWNFLKMQKVFEKACPNGEEPHVYEFLVDMKEKISEIASADFADIVETVIERDIGQE